MHGEETKKETPLLTWKVPLCCLEARDDCPHSGKKYEQKKRRNPGL